MCKSAAVLTVLVASLALCSARPADILARVPSSYIGGSKWVLFRDDSIPNPPPHVIQAENGVQVLPTYRYQQAQYQQPRYFQGYAAVTAGPGHVGVAPVIGDFDTEVVESKPHGQEQPEQQPQYDYDQGQGHDQESSYDFHNQLIKQQQQQQSFQLVKRIQQQQPIVKVSSVTVSPAPFAISSVTPTPFGISTVTHVPHTAVHVEGPAYFDYLRKKKSTA